MSHNNGIIKIGHRGAPLQAHENTLQSFNKAIESGMDGVELDVQYSSDKQLVVFHDWKIKTSTGKNDYINNISYDELKTILLNKNGDKIPILAEVLDNLANNCTIVIEIKCARIVNTGIEKDILHILNKYNIEKNCMISSFNPFVIRRIRKFNPDILTAFLWTNKDPQFIINTPLWVWLCRPDSFHCDINFLESELMNWIKRKNLSVFVYTIINQQQLHKARELCVDGIIMDDPHLN